ncbi:hypothetical protein HY968_05010 [Candidatus Kaiserbacteria bacterium]|nr:hypothetical protein [Candidatus Kaiserbacteria bacterium]
MARRISTSPLGHIEREILTDLSGSDLLIGFLCSARSTKRMFKLAKDRAARRYRTRLAIERLTTQGLVRQKGRRVSITDTGLKAIDSTISKTRALLGNKKWDFRWRIVSYDIPETHKKLRDAVRGILIRAGFKKLHHSLWIFPHECHELTELIRKETGLRKYLLYAVVDKIENEEHLRKSFPL